MGRILKPRSTSLWMFKGEPASAQVQKAGPVGAEALGHRTQIDLQDIEYISVYAL